MLRRTLLLLLVVMMPAHAAPSVCALVASRLRVGEMAPTNLLAGLPGVAEQPAEQGDPRNILRRHVPDPREDLLYSLNPRLTWLLPSRLGVIWDHGGTCLAPEAIFFTLSEGALTTLPNLPEIESAPYLYSDLWLGTVEGTPTSVLHQFPFGGRQSLVARRWEASGENQACSLGLTHAITLVPDGAFLAPGADDTDLAALALRLVEEELATPPNQPLPGTT